MESSVEVSELFITPLWRVNCRDEFKKSLSSYVQLINKLRKDGEGDEGDNRSSRNGWRLDDVNLKDDFKSVTDEIIYGLSSILADEKVFNSSKTYDYRIESWINLTNKGGFNAVHNHGLWSISGVLYIKCPKDSGRLLIRDPRPAVYYHKLLQQAGEEIVIEPKEGLIVFFPGFLEHSVELNKSRQDRISIAFNISLTPK